MRYLIQATDSMNLSPEIDYTNCSVRDDAVIDFEDLERDRQRSRRVRTSSLFTVKNGHAASNENQLTILNQLQSLTLAGSSSSLQGREEKETEIEGGYVDDMMKDGKSGENNDTIHGANSSCGSSSSSDNNNHHQLNCILMMASRWGDSLDLENFIADCSTRDGGSLNTDGDSAGSHDVTPVVSNRKSQVSDYTIEYQGPASPGAEACSSDETRNQCRNIGDASESCSDDTPEESIWSDLLGSTSSGFTNHTFISPRPSSQKRRTSSLPQRSGGVDCAMETDSYTDLSRLLVPPIDELESCHRRENSDVSMLNQVATSFPIPSLATGDDNVAHRLNKKKVRFTTIEVMEYDVASVARCCSGGSLEEKMLRPPPQPFGRRGDRVGRRRRNSSSPVGRRSSIEHDFARGDESRVRN